MSLTLYSTAGNLRLHRIEIAAQLLNVPLNIRILEYRDLKSKQYLAKHPLGKIPLLETPEGYIFESGAIVRYIANRGNGLYGKPNTFQRFEVDQWLEFSSTELDPPNYAVLEAIFGWGVPETKTRHKYDAAKKELKDLMKVLELTLKSRTYLVGDALSVADICIAVQLHFQFQLVFDQKAREGFPNLMRWFNHVSSIPQYIDVLGKKWLCEKEYPVVFPGQEGAISTQNEKKEPAQKETKPKEKQQSKKLPAAPQQAKPKAPAKQEEEEQDTEEKEISTKKKNPLDELPKSSFSLDDFKRTISNTNDRAAVLQEFWKNYDPAGWSLWRVEYQKYEGEGKVGYLTANLKNGFERNLDHFRKYAFAGSGVYGIEPNFDIRGAWLWRGVDIPAEWKEHQSYEYHTFTKLDHTKEADRKLVEQYWINTQEGTFVEGLPVFEAKHFK